MRGLSLVGTAVMLAGVAGCAAGSAATAAKVVGTPDPKATATASDTFRKTCPPVADGSPSFRLALPKAARQLGKTVRADVDGDGRLDTVRLMSGWHTADGFDVDQLVVRFADGGSAEVQIPDDVSPGNQLLGIADINDDRRAEVIVSTGGNTILNADTITLVDHKLMVATTCRYDGTDGWYRISPLDFAAVGNACGPWCDATSACRSVDGEPRLIRVNGAAVRRPAMSDHVVRKDWDVTIYRLVGADFVKTATYQGSVRGDGPLPSRWPFLNALSCGTATFPG